MATEVTMPRLGWDMKVGSVTEWLKRDGERVEAGEPICVIAGDKANVELEAPDSGVLRLTPRTPGEGVEVPVGTLLAYLVGAGEDVPTHAAVAERVRVVATPRARRAAASLGVDWRTLTGSGRGGRILERDVVPATRTTSTTTAARPLSGIRRITAERMSASAQSVAPVTLTTEADATALVRLREQTITESAQMDTAPGYTDLLVKIVGLALTEHPGLNAQLTEDGIVQQPQVNIAVAVDTNAGLLAPVITNVAQRSVEAIAQETGRLVEAARAGRSRQEDLAGATFTITNLGMYDVDAFTPIVTLPQCAILGVGRIVAKPVVVDDVTGRVEARRMLTLSLTFDHRVVDGAPAARFLQRVKHLVERPTLWLFR